MNYKTKTAEEQAIDSEVNALLKMAHSPLHNYVIPGVTSWLLGQPSPHGTVRLFTCSREHQEAVAPHSHRFDFHARVVRGWVRNRIWANAVMSRNGDPGDEYMPSKLIYQGEPGAYSKVEQRPQRCVFQDTVYAAGEVYSMKASEIHSIYFSRDAVVQFFEGPTITDTSIVLEPYVGGGRVPTFKTEPWMFQSKTASQQALEGV